MIPLLLKLDMSISFSSQPILAVHCFPGQSWLGAKLSTGWHRVRSNNDIWPVGLSCPSRRQTLRCHHNTYVFPVECICCAPACLARQTRSCSTTGLILRHIYVDICAHFKSPKPISCSKTTLPSLAMPILQIALRHNRQHGYICCEGWLYRRGA